MTKKNKEILRTCIVSKKQFQKDDLIRLVRLSDNEVVVDVTGKMNGRGAYISNSKEVIEEKSLRFRIQNALKVKLSDDDYEKLLCEIKEGAKLE